VFLRDTGDGTIEVSFWAGDTLGQARVLYNRPDVLARLRVLAQQPEWEVRPNFHFGAWTDGRCHTRGPIRLEEYLTLWERRINLVQALPREDWDSYWADMVKRGVIDPRDRSEFDKWFTNTRQVRATPRPGIVASRRWSLEQARKLDTDGLLVDAVAGAIEVVLKTCGAAIERPDDTTQSLGPDACGLTHRGDGSEAAEVERDRRIVAEVAARRRAAGKPWTDEIEARMLQERAERRRRSV
jgi:hypothetical protein